MPLGIHPAQVPTIEEDLPLPTLGQLLGQLVEGGGIQGFLGRG